MRAHCFSPSLARGFGPGRAASLARPFPEPLAHRFARTAQGGFTLVEMVMVIVILGVVSSMVAVAMRGPVDAYFAAARRAALTDVADGVMRRLERDVRKALPNSLRTPSNQCLEFIPTKTGGRYRADGSAAALNFDTTDTSFNMLGRNSTLPADQRIVARAGLVAGDFVVVYNLGPSVPGADAYNLDNLAEVTGLGTEFQNTTPLNGWESPISISSKQFPLASGGNRFHVVPGAERVVSYVCSGGALYRTVNASNFTSSCPSSEETSPSDASAEMTRQSNCELGLRLAMPAASADV